jgi:hypothetical protein
MLRRKEKIIKVKNLKMKAIFKTTTSIKIKKTFGKKNMEITTTQLLILLTKYSTLKQ